MPGLTREEKQKRKRGGGVISFDAPPKRPAHAKKKRTWDESYQILAKFKQKHGHCHVPLRYKDDRALGGWVATVRSKAASNELTQEQRSKLDNLGFDWETKQERLDRQWLEKFQRLKRYRLENGHCCVPQYYMLDPKLASFVNTSRSLQAIGRLRADREKLLNSIDFTWRQRTCVRDLPKAHEIWLKNYSKLESFKQETGHTMVPYTFHDTALATWVGHQRRHFAQKTLKKNRKDLLDELGFVYRIDAADPDASRSQREWDDMFQRLLEFKDEFGHVNVHRSYRKAGLGNWMSVQRANARNGILDPRRKVRLEAAGVSWGKAWDERWEKNFAKLLEFKRQHGHCRVPSSGPNVPDEALGHWVVNQRLFEKAGSLLPERKAKLDAVGFLWRGEVPRSTIASLGNTRGSNSSWSDEESQLSDDDMFFYDDDRSSSVETNQVENKQESKSATTVPKPNCASSSRKQKYPTGTRFLKVKSRLFSHCAQTII